MSNLSEEVVLRMHPEVFLIVHEFLYNTKLGDRNTFESALSDFMVSLDDYDVAGFVNMLEGRFGKVSISANFSNEDGMVFSVEPSNE